MHRAALVLLTVGAASGSFWKDFTKRPDFASRLQYHPDTGEKLVPSIQCNLTGTWSMRNLSASNNLKGEPAQEYFITSTSPTDWNVVAVSSGVGWSEGQGKIYSNGTVTAEIDKSSTQGIHLTGSIPNCSTIIWNNEIEWFKQVQIKKVHIVFMNHLDIGYAIHTPEGNPIGFMANVINSYTSEYFPGAAQLAATLREIGGEERFIYTTHPWLVSLYIDCPDDFILANGTKLYCPTSEEVATFKESVSKGDITWHDGPFNLQSEALPPNLFELSLKLSTDINKKLNVPDRTHKIYNLRDVPGSTRAVVPLLAKNNFSCITVGQNGGTPTPPGWYPHKIFSWKHTDGSRILGLNHAGGYPNDPGPSPQQCGGLCRDDCMIAEGFDEALCFAFRTDNSGPPPSVQDVVNVFSILKVEFPGAQIEASTLHNFVESAVQSMSKFPEYTEEIGDTWIQGVQSDPLKVSKFRAYARSLESCLATGGCIASDWRILNSTRLAITLPEHTWGLPGTSDNVHWNNSDFEKSRLTNVDFINLENGWEEHRKWLDYAIEALADHPVRATVMNEIEKLTCPTGQPSTSGYTQIPLNSLIMFEDIKYQFGINGSIVMLQKAGTQYASTSHPLGDIVYSTYTDTDFNEMNSVYHGPTGGGCGYYKPNMDKFGNPVREDTSPVLEQLFASKDNRTTLAKMSMSSKTNLLYGNCEYIWLNVTIVKESVQMEYLFYNKTATRLAEAMHVSFYPTTAGNWTISKMGELIDPHNTIQNGNPKQHGVWGPVFKNGFSINSLDASVVSPITSSSPPTPFLKDLSPITDTIIGMGFNIWNNIWETNYAFYYPFIRGEAGLSDRNVKARFSILL
eukprot:TRINITY_DN4083_c0_g1_i1.p1 TRINITY_DN4083_c0_g1~~TRINITY_DN4083_c0_g1_i1.p1  ORF type:complete len:882 (+),score=208.03 TRINITY_DN4083_c0_g1_i1:95-2647(+)